MVRIVSRFKQLDCTSNQIVNDLESIDAEELKNQETREKVIQSLESYHDISEQKFNLSIKINLAVRSALYRISRLAKRKCSFKEDIERQLSIKYRRNSLPTTRIPVRHLSVNENAWPGEEINPTYTAALEEELDDLEEEFSNLKMLADVAVYNSEIPEDECEPEPTLPKIAATKRGGQKKKRKPRKRKSKKPVEAGEEEEGNVAVNVEAEENEPLYCICNKPSYGQMVECDHGQC